MPDIKKQVRAIMKRGQQYQPVNRQLAGLVGASAAAAVQHSIVRLREPPNSPYTIARKGSSNPLIDTGTMRTAVSWVVVP